MTKTTVTIPMRDRDGKIVKVRVEGDPRQSSIKLKDLEVNGLELTLADIIGVEVRHEVVEIG